MKSEQKSLDFTYDWTGENSEKEAKTQLDNIAKLEDGWNGYGAKKFSERLVNNIERILPVFTYMPLIFPTATNAIQLEWEAQNGDYLEVEVYEDYFTIFVIQSKKEKEFQKHYSLDIAEDLINTLLELIFDQN